MQFRISPLLPAIAARLSHHPRLVLDAPPKGRSGLGDYIELGRHAARAIPHATLVEYPDLGHAPQVQDPARFNADLVGALARP